MTLIDIKEPKNIGISTTDQTIAIGIDFGTSNSLVSYAKNQKPYIIKYDNNKGILPSVVTFNKDGDISTIGDTVSSGIKISSVKRLLGKGLDEILHSKAISPAIKKLLINSDDNSINFKVAHKIITPIEVSAQIIKYLVQQAEQSLKQKINKAVISVPAYFDDIARSNIYQAAIMANLEVLRLISEPTAAAYAYGLDKNAQGTYLVYDLGGGTFDVSLLKISNKILQVIATGGDNHLGGDDIDYLLRDYFLNKLDIHDTKYSKDDTEFLAIITKYAKRAKEHLTYNDLFTQDVQYNNKVFILSITRTEFENIIYDIINRTISIVRQVISEASDISSELAGIILVGGASNIPLIKDLLLQKFKLPILSDVNPETVVAAGAALQAENLISARNKHLLIDITPLSVGLEVMGGTTEILIHRNSPIPTSITRKFTTQMHNQSAIIFHVVQGERERAVDCRSLARFILKGLPSAPAGRVSVDVNFTIDADGLLFVSTHEIQTGNYEFVTIKSACNVSTDEVNNILENAYKNNVADYNYKVLNDAITKASLLCNNISQLLIDNAHLIAEVVANLLRDDISYLRHAIESKDINDITSLTSKLESDSKKLLIDKLNSDVQLTLKGKNINELINKN